jgi:hypothetical protein
MTKVTNLFDINVWNRGAYLTEGLPATEQYDEWVLCPYTIIDDKAGYGYGRELSELNLVLTYKESDELTLGWSQDLGGNYYPDDDFWIDSETFKDTYKDMPEIVRVWLDFVAYNL